MAYNAKDPSDEQETMYRFLTPGETEQTSSSPSVREGTVIGRKLHRISTIYLNLVTSNQPNEDPPLYKCLAPCLLITGFGIGSALVILFFYMGFAYGIDEGIMVGLFAFASWLYALVMYCKKIGFFRPVDTSTDGSVSSLPAIVIVNHSQDPPSYKEVAGSPPSYRDALKMIETIQGSRDRTVVTIAESDQTTQPCSSTESGKQIESVHTRL